MTILRPTDGDFSHTFAAVPPSGGETDRGLRGFSGISGFFGLGSGFEDVNLLKVSTGRLRLGNLSEIRLDSLRAMMIQGEIACKIGGFGLDQEQENLLCP